MAPARGCRWLLHILAAVSPAMAAENVRVSRTGPVASKADFEIGRLAEIRRLTEIGRLTGLGGPAELGGPAGLPLPSKTPIAIYETRLFEFLNRRTYQDLKWKRDKGIRDTGPYIDGNHYGTPPSVRVFYSPEMMTWLMSGRTTEIPDGAMIIKEQYSWPAAPHHGKTDSELWDDLLSWTIMVKDSAGSHDGWFWSNPSKDGRTKNNHHYEVQGDNYIGFEYPVSGFGHYCVRCHAATKSPGETNEFTFSSLRNIEGFPGEPILFRVDDSWLQLARQEEKDAEDVDLSNEDRLVEVSAKAAHPNCLGGLGQTQCSTQLNDLFLTTFPTVSRRHEEDVLHMPPVTHD